MPRFWTDQPEELDQAKQLLHVPGGKGKSFILYEAELGDYRWAISAGNLFGSRTVWCNSIYEALEIMNQEVQESLR